MIQTNFQANHKGHDNDNCQTNEEAPPLQLPGAFGVLDAFVELDVAGFGVLFHVLSVLFCLLDGLVLEDDLGGEVFHYLVEFDEGAFNLLDVVVAGADGAEDRVGCC